MIALDFGHIPEISDHELTKAIQTVENAEKQIARVRNKLLAEQIRRQGIHQLTLAY
jgi:hypothetical protein